MTYIKQDIFESYFHKLSKEFIKKYKGHPDAFLTKKGHAQATETGRFLKTYLANIEKREGRKFDKIILKSSPFIRSVATATSIGK